jgi:dihydrofolate reductase
MKSRLPSPPSFTKEDREMPGVTADLTITLDGYAAGEGQSRESPFGDLDPDQLHGWMFDHGEENAEEIAAFNAAGAYVMGRLMFSSDQGEWDLDWKGWWGANPPFHAPTFILCHRPRPSVEMEGGTVYHFVTEGIEAALEQAREAAGENDVSIAGGPGTINQYLAAGLVDELRVHLVPFVAGGGERLFVGVGDLTLKPVSSRTTPHVTHLVYRR